jgi:hypothetical protein
MVIERALLEDDDVRGPASERIGLPTRPQDVPDMPLFSAAYWIASKGGAEDFNVEDHAAWHSAIETLLERVRSNDLKLSGRQSERDLPSVIPSEVFRGVLPVVPPYQSNQDYADAVFDDVARLELRPTVDLHDGGDKLFSGNREPAWTDLRVSGPDLARLWPFPESPPAHLSKPSESSVANPRAGASETDLQIFRAMDCLWSGIVPAIKWVDCKRSVENHIEKSGGTAPSDSSFKRFKKRWWQSAQTHSA